MIATAPAGPGDGWTGERAAGRGRRGGADGDPPVPRRRRAARPARAAPAVRRALPAGSALRRGRADAPAGRPKPRVLFVVRTRYGLPRTDGAAAVRGAVGRPSGAFGTSPDGPPVDDARSGSAAGTGALDGPLFYALLPGRVARELRRFRPDVVAAQLRRHRPRAARAALRRRAPRSCSTCTATGATTHGSTARGAEPAQPVARPPRPPCSAMPTVSAPSRGSRRGSCRTPGCEPTATFPAYMDLEPFRALPPRPPRRNGGALRRSARALQGVDVLAASWHDVARALPGRGCTSSAGPLAPLIEERRRHIRRASAGRRSSRRKVSPPASTPRRCWCRRPAGKEWGG